MGIDVLNSKHREVFGVSKPLACHKTRMLWENDTTLANTHIFAFSTSKITNAHSIAG